MTCIYSNVTIIHGATQVQLFLSSFFEIDFRGWTNHNRDIDDVDSDDGINDIDPETMPESGAGDMNNRINKI